MGFGFIQSYMFWQHQNMATTLQGGGALNLFLVGMCHIGFQKYESLGSCKILKNESVGNWISVLNFHQNYRAAICSEWCELSTKMLKYLKELQNWGYPN